MAIFYPSLEKINELKVKPEPGEWYLLNFLKIILSNAYEVFFNPFLNGDRPDIVILKKGAGILIIEVKDWEFRHYSINERKKWEVKGKNSAFIKSPIDQVLQYKQNIYNLHIEDLLYKKIMDYKYWNVVNCAVYFHKESRESITDFIVSPFEHDEKYMKFLNKNISFLGYDDLESKIFKDLLWKKYMTLNNSKYFKEDLYQSFKRYLQPPVHTIEDGKVIKYNQEQQKLINSEPVEELIKGVVGSGKTTVLAVRAVNAHIRTGGRVLILTYNITLKNYVHDKISQVRSEFSWENFYITNYHSFLTAEFNNVGISVVVPEGFEKWNDDDKSEYFEVNYYSNVSIFEPYQDHLEKYDAMFIDEIQDYKFEWMEILKKYFLKQGGEYVLLGDEKQNIYDNKLEEEEREIITNIRDKRRKRKLNISNRFGDKIGRIALDFQKQVMAKKYNIDSLTTTGGLDLGFVKYFYIEKGEDISPLYNHVQSIISDLKEHPSNVALLGYTIKLLREYDCYYRYRTGEKSKTMFESQEVYYKFIFDNYIEQPAIQKGINLLNNSKLKENYKKVTQLAILFTVRSLYEKYRLHSFMVRLQEMQKKYLVNINEFESWFEDENLQKLLKAPLDYKIREKIKNVRDNRKLHFWFNSGTMKLSTIHSFKGWEAPTLFLIIEKEYLEGDFKMSFEELIYTGLTRSKERLIVINYGNMEQHEKLKNIFPHNLALA
ncbi:nuclease-related domain-containing DEAD/DEAH box helicase [Pontibacter ruber]|uniref:DNA 3'-5' helicase II n=1 Tax=Pontibacter ruber TaxID=1343895 RepID=A0ABW5D1R7_9BACT|nr:NERD domain-containing protein [Pontibacter ruber]